MPTSVIVNQPTTTVTITIIAEELIAEVDRVTTVTATTPPATIGVYENIFAIDRVNTLETTVTKLNNKIYKGGIIVDPVEDYGCDPTGVVNNTAKFAQINTDLVALGGGIIKLPPDSLFLANLNLSALISIEGWGRYSSRIQGVTGANVPVIKKDCFQGDFVRGIGIYGTIVWASGDPGAPNDPEYGLYLFHSGGWWSAAIIEDIYVTVARGRGFGDYIQGAWFDRCEGSYCGGVIFDQAGGSTDTYVNNSVFSTSFGNGRNISAVGLSSHWTRVKANVAGIKFDSTTHTWVADNANTTAIGWGIGTDQDLAACISEDNPIGYQVLGDGSTVRGLSAGDKIPVYMNQLDGPTGDGGTVIDVDVRCNDRFVPAMGVEMVESFGSKISVNIDWQSASVSGPMAETGTQIKNKSGFKVFSDFSPGFNAIYNGNNYRVNTEDGWNFWANGSGALTPDLVTGTNYFISINGDMTINSFNHRFGLGGGKVIKFFLSTDGTPGHKVTFDSSYGLAQSIVTLPASTMTVIEFIQTSPNFSPAWKLKTRIPFGSRFVDAKRTAGNLVLNQALTTTWADVGVPDLVLANCAIGDEIFVGASFLWNSDANIPVVDCASIVSAAPFSYWGTAGGITDDGVLAWCGAPSGQFSGAGGTVSKKLVSGDIASDGSVTIRLRYRMQTANVNKTLFATSTIPFYWWAENRGAQIT